MASFKNLISNTSAQISSGGTITGDLVINGDLQVDGGGSLSFDEIIEGTQVIDVTNTEALLVRKDGDGGDVFIVDTTNSRVGINQAPSYALDVSGTIRALGGNLFLSGANSVKNVNNALNLDSASGQHIAMRPNNGSEIARFDSTGLGIGATTIQQLLHIEKDDADVGIALTQSGQRSWSFGIDNSDSDRLKIGYSTTIGTNTVATFTESGTLGIGATSIDRAGYGSTVLTAEGIGATALELVTTRADANGASLANIGFWYNTNSTNHQDVARIIALSEGTTANQRGCAITFFTKADGSTTLSERLRISNDGNIGIGISSNIQSKLHVIDTADGSAVNVMYLQNLGTSASSEARLFFGSGSNTTRGAYIGHINTSASGQPADLTFATSSAYATPTERMRLNSTGLGIGGTPTQPLNIFHSSHAIALLESSGTDSASSVQFKNDARTYQIGVRGSASDSFIIRDSTATTDILTIDSSQNVGIGTSSPDSAPKLHIHKASAGSIDSHSSSVLTLEDDGPNILQFLSPSNQQAQVRFGDTSDDGAGFISYNHDGDTMSFGVGGPTRLTITSGVLSLKSGRLRLSDNETDNTNKESHIISSQYDTDESEGYMAMRIASNSADNHVSIGGGHADVNASTLIRFFTASNKTTRTGTERMRINSTGVGVNCDNPLTELHVKGRGEILRIENTTDASGNTFMSFFDTSALKGYLGFTGGSSDHYVLYNNENADMRFFTNQTLHMNLDASGNLGIGTGSDSLSHMLTVKNSGVGHAHVNIESTDNTYVSFLQLSTNGNDWQIAAGGSSHSTFADSFYIYDTTNSRSIFRLDANSRISLSNNDAGSGNTVFGYLAGQSIDAGSDNNVFIGERVADASLNDASNNIGLGYYALSSLINGDNNVVIGSSAGLNITGTSSVVLIGKQAGESINSADALGAVAVGHQALKDNTSGQANTAVGYLAGKNNTTGDNNTIIGYLANYAGGTAINQTTAVGTLSLANATGSNNTALGYNSGDVITSGTNNTILGYASDPSANDATNQTVIGASAVGIADNSVTLGNSSVTKLYVAPDCGTSATQSIVFKDTGGEQGQVVYDHGNGQFQFYVEGGIKARIESGGAIYLDGGGIKFPATQVAHADANTLDDYEEGTWTAGITFDSGSATFNSGLDTGKYTKIGNVVHVQGFFQLASVSSPSGDVNITGLPFTNPNHDEGQEFSAVTVNMTDVASALNGSPQAYVPTNATHIFLEKFNEGGTNAGTSRRIGTHIGASTTILISATYQI